MGSQGRSPRQGLGAVAPHSAPARMPGVYAQRLCTMQSQPSIHSPSPRGRGLGLGIENKHFFWKNRLFLQSETAVKNGCLKAFLLTVSTAPRRTFVRLSERFPCLRVFLSVFSVSKKSVFIKNMKSVAKNKQIW